MMIVGQVSTPEEATEVEFIAKSFVVANRARALALLLKKQKQRKPSQLISLLSGSTSSTKSKITLFL
jgi:hypothetical protein